MNDTNHVDTFIGRWQWIKSGDLADGHVGLVVVIALLGVGTTECFGKFVTQQLGWVSCHSFLLAQILLIRISGVVPLLRDIG